MIEIDEELAKRLLKFQYTDIGYGHLRCNSCGAAGFMDYDNASMKTEKCSKNCPYYKLKKATYPDLDC